MRDPIEEDVAHGPARSLPKPDEQDPEQAGISGQLGRRGPTANETTRKMRESVADIMRHGFAEFRSFVNPLIAERARLAREPIELTRVAHGVLHDEAGTEYEDLHGTQMLGHRNPAVADAIRTFLD